MTLMQIAFVVLCAAAAGGATLTLCVALRMRYPAFLGSGHGIAGLTGLVLLYAAHLFGGAPVGVWWGLILITFALLGGLVLLRTLFRQKIPLWLALGHGVLGASGLYLIYPLAFGN